MERQNNIIDVFLNFGKRNIAFTKTKVDGISPIEYKLPATREQESTQKLLINIENLFVQFCKFLK